MRKANDMLARFADRLPTRRALCEPGLTARMPERLADALGHGAWLLLADENTWAAQGARLAEALVSAGQAFETLICQPTAGRDQCVCESALVGLADEVLASGQFAAVVAVGSGTLCDTGKLSAASAGLPLAAVATAPSMNGYPSVIAAVLREGVKRTEPTVPPRLVLADLDVLADAPGRMLAAGLADLLAKPVATADWTLAHHLVGDAISADGLAVVDESLRLAEGIAGDLSRREAGAVGRLFEALFISGLAMAVSGASSPASGGEHLVSHYLDMTALADGRAHELHGLQVGLGTLVTAALWRRLLDAPPAATARPRPWPELRDELADHFGPTLAPAVLAQAEQLYGDPDAVAERLARFQRTLPTMRAALAERLAGADRIEAELAECGAATRFSQIGVDRARAESAVRFAPFIRARYTILHLLAELGVLDEWGGEAVARFA